MTLWSAIKLILLAAVVAVLFVIGFGLLSELGEKSGPSLEDKNERTAKEIMRPPKKTW